VRNKRDADGQVLLDLGDRSVTAGSPPRGEPPDMREVKPTGPRPTFVIEYIRRIGEDGEVDRLDLVAGVNLLVGPPNTGKSKWVL